MSEFIYIYDDDGVSKLGVASLMLSVRKYLQRDIKVINAEQLIQNGLENAVALIIPGGADLPYCAKLNGKGNQIIHDFVAKGGVYIGICAGAYYACGYVDFVGREYQVQGERELCFFQGVAKGSLPHLASGHLFDESANSKAMISLQFEDLTKSPPLYYHGGPTFIPNRDYLDYQIIARYSDQQPAIITGQFGQGHYFLSGVHFELEKSMYEEMVVNYAKHNITSKEQDISKQIDENYGKEIWQKLSVIIKNGANSLV